MGAVGAAGEIPGAVDDSAGADAGADAGAAADGIGGHSHEQHAESQGADGTSATQTVSGCDWHTDAYLHTHSLLHWEATVLKKEVRLDGTVLHCRDVGETGPVVRVLKIGLSTDISMDRSTDSLMDNATASVLAVSAVAVPGCVVACSYAAVDRSYKVTKKLYSFVIFVICCP